MANECPKCHTNNPDTAKFCGECGTPLEADVIHTKTLETPTEELTRGSVFAGRYEIIEELGKGGMGRVYRVEDTKAKEEIALKFIKPEIAADKKTIERFRNELTTARKISHRNICRMFDLGEEKGQHFITMEYVAGEDLKSLIRRVKVDMGTTVKIAKQVCEGLSEAHRLGVVHRDLKPSNIMIDKEGDARIMDFGIARTLKAKGVTGSGVMVGTPEYMSPEQAGAKDIDQRSDIYSLGVILYEMTTGRLPFEGDTPFTIGMKHKGEMPKNPKELNTQIPDDLNCVILRCLEKNRETRYKSAEELCCELENIEKGIPTKEREIPKRKPITSREITVTFGLKKLLIPALAVFVVAIAAVIVWQLIIRKGAVPAPSERPSVVVLPFEDLSPEKDQDYFCEGLADSIINALTKIKDLRVPARGSSFSFKGKEKNYAEIAEKLEVNTVLDGSLQKSMNRIRITVQLINAADESILWAEVYDRESNDIFAIQDEISLAIVDTLKVSLLGEEKTILTKRYTESVEAYNLYLQGRFFWNKRTAEGLNKAKSYFENAIAADPNFALGYAGLADVYNMLGDYTILPKKDVYPKAREAALKALEMDSRLSEAYTSLAWVKMDYDWDWEGAEKEFKRAIELNPGYGTARLWYSWMLLATSRFEEAIEEIRIAQELDPLSPLIRTVFAQAYYYYGKYDQALDKCKESIEIEEATHWAHDVLGKIYLEKSLFKEAISEFQKAIDFSSGNVVWYFGDLGYAYAVMKKRDKAHEILAELNERSKQQYVPNYVFALIYFGLAEKELAFSYLEKAVEEYEIPSQGISANPIFSDFRNYPKFKEILKKMNIEDHP